MNNQTYKPNNAPKIIAGGMVSVAVMAAVLFFLIDHSHTTQAGVTATPTTTAVDANSTYKGGTYTASADYSVPRDTNTIGVTLTVKNGLITTVSTQDSYGDRESERYISNFKSSISQAIVGKSLQAAGVSRLSGASETSTGFNTALQAILSQAKA
jgi:uncharacterized protein with FMN-binding domain